MASRLHTAPSMKPPLLDPSLLEGLSEAEKQEALAAAAAARRAEERAEQRALQRALEQREQQRKLQQQQSVTNEAGSRLLPTSTDTALHGDDAKERVVYVSKKKRGLQNNTDGTASSSALSLPGPSINSMSANGHNLPRATAGGGAKTSLSSNPATTRTTYTSGWTERELEAVKEAYLGKSTLGTDDAEEEAQKLRKKQRSSKVTFKFRWEDTEDTFRDDDPLYSTLGQARGNHAQRGSSNNNNSRNNNTARKRKNFILDDAGDMTTLHTVKNKPLHTMTARDWRIFRENFEIVVRGGRAPPPMRSFRESPLPGEIPPLHPALLDAIENVLGFKEPSPIQRQAIPIGLQRRDLIGIAETGSGKTAAFGLPLCHYLLNLPSKVLERVAEDGPLALVMAPTRELALQIDGEFTKLLSRQNLIRTCAIVGGQAIQQQAQVLRRGVHVVVGTPGRINECIEMAYLVLNQCSYIILDEADRMIDMGFAPQMESILDAMGGTLKSENESEAYQQELDDLKKGDVARHRLTAMFSATMPPEVERMAKQYLRHPAIVSIGDRDSSKNARIVQKVIWLSSPAQKESALRDQLLNPRFVGEKVIVFVNEKKHADYVGRMVERIGRPYVVLHGGKSQEQREESLGNFRKGGIIMVATDVAGRGLDIPDVAHVINFDLPTRSIENYTHRIGRTGRAGKDGLATSFITEEDEGIMAALKSYLESTGNEVPARLARHPAANSAPQSNIIF